MKLPNRRINSLSSAPKALCILLLLTGLSQLFFNVRAQETISKDSGSSTDRSRDFNTPNANAQDALSESWELFQENHRALYLIWEQHQRSLDAMSRAWGQRQKNPEALSEAAGKFQNTQQIMSKVWDQRQRNQEAMSRIWDQRQRNQEAMSRIWEQRQRNQEAMSRIWEQRANASMLQQKRIKAKSDLEKHLGDVNPSIGTTSTTMGVLRSGIKMYRFYSDYLKLSANIISPPSSGGGYRRVISNTYSSHQPTQGNTSPQYDTPRNEASHFKSRENPLIHNPVRSELLRSSIRANQSVSPFRKPSKRGGVLMSTSVKTNSFINLRSLLGDDEQ